METRKTIGYKLIKDYFGRKIFFKHIGIGYVLLTSYIDTLNSLSVEFSINIDEFNMFPENWQPVYEQVPIAIKDVNEIVLDIEKYIFEHSDDHIYSSFNKKFLLNHITIILTRKLLPFLFLLISLTGFSQQSSNINIIESFISDSCIKAEEFDDSKEIEKNIFKSDSAYYARQSTMRAISTGYHNFELQKDRSMMFGIVAGMMAPTIGAYIICRNNNDKIGKVFYGSYAAIDLAAVFLFVRSEIKVRKIKRHYLKLENQ